jgi:fructuronate reductase
MNDAPPAFAPTRTRLSAATAGRAAPVLLRPGYLREQTTIGVAHFGPGAFHRAHQACFIDRLLERDPTRAISAIALRSPGVRDALEPQDGLYVLAELDRDPSLRLIGAIRELLVAAEAPERVAARLADPKTQVVTATVTEKGYGLNAAGELDFSDPDILVDLKGERAPTTLVGWLVEGLRLRRQAGLKPFVTVACDNLADNGFKLGRAVARFAETRDPGLARWIEDEARFPRTMVDSITPATDDALRARIEAETGLFDAWPVQREAFVQWVVEAVDAPGLPDWESVGVTITRDVPGYDQAKLRLLNGAHSALAYLGLLGGFDTTAEASMDPVLGGFVERLMRKDLRAGLRAPDGLDLDAYIAALLARFRNPFLRHTLAQIAWDGTQKLRVRYVPPILEAKAAGRPVDRLVLPLAAWMLFVARRSRSGIAIVDPEALTLAEIGTACSGDAEHDVGLFLGLGTLFPPEIVRDAGLRTALQGAYAGLQRDGLGALPG